MTIEPITVLGTTICFTDPLNFGLLRDVAGYHLETDSVTD